MRGGDGIVFVLPGVTQNKISLIYISLLPFLFSFLFFFFFSRTSSNRLAHSFIHSFIHSLLAASAFTFSFFVNTCPSDASSSSFKPLHLLYPSVQLARHIHIKMLFVGLSALILLASTVAATPHHHQKGKWEPSCDHSDFPSMKDVSTGFTGPAGTGLVTPPTTSVPHVLSVSSIESGGDGIEKENPQPNTGLPSFSAPAKAVSSATAGNTAPTKAASPSDSSGVTYTATFTEYVHFPIDPLPSLPPPTVSSPHSSSYLPPPTNPNSQVRTRRRQRLPQLQRRHRFLRLLQHPRLQRRRLPEPVRRGIGQDRHLRHLLAAVPGLGPQRCRYVRACSWAQLHRGHGEQSLPCVG